MRRETDDGFVCPVCDTVVYRDQCACTVALEVAEEEHGQEFVVRHERNGGAQCEGNGERLLTQSPSPFTESEDHGQAFVRKMFGGASFANEGRKP